MTVGRWVLQLSNPWGAILRCVIHSLSEDPRGMEAQLPVEVTHLLKHLFLAFFPSLPCFSYLPCFLRSPPKQATGIPLLFQGLFFWRNLHSDKASIWYFPKVSLRNRGIQPLFRHPPKVVLILLFRAMTGLSIRVNCSRISMSTFAILCISSVVS